MKQNWQFVKICDKSPFACALLSCVGKLHHVVLIDIVVQAMTFLDPRPRSGGWKLMVEELKCYQSASRKPLPKLVTGALILVPIMIIMSPEHVQWIQSIFTLTWEAAKQLLEIQAEENLCSSSYIQFCACFSFCCFHTFMSNFQAKKEWRSLHPEVIRELGFFKAKLLFLLWTTHRQGT